MRARYPDVEGFVERDGVKVGYEVFGTGEPAVVFCPTDALVHSRLWKAQVPYLARTSKVVTIDPRGNGRSGRPQSASAYADTKFVADTIAVMDAADISQAVLVGLCTSSWRALLTAALHPGRVLGVVAMATLAPFLAPPLPARAEFGFDDVLETDEGWAKDNRHYWLRDWRGCAEFFFGELHCEAVRADLGYQPGEKVCVVTAGGSGVGTGLLRRAVAAFPAAKRLIPGLRMIVITGPRIDPASLPSAEGLDVRGYVPDLYRHLAACDLAVTHGGLTTTMELTAGQRPFLYVPLRHHFEQNFHVRHRLAQYGAGRCLDYDETVPDVLARAMADEIARPVRYRPVEHDGAARAAAQLAVLIGG